MRILLVAAIPIYLLALSGPTDAVGGPKWPRIHVNRALKGDKIHPYPGRVLSFDLSQII